MRLQRTTCPSLLEIVLLFLKNWKSHIPGNPSNPSRAGCLFGLGLFVWLGLIEGGRELAGNADPSDGQEVKSLRSIIS